MESDYVKSNCKLATWISLGTGLGFRKKNNSLHICIIIFCCHLVLMCWYRRSKYDMIGFYCLTDLFARNSLFYFEISYEQWIINRCIETLEIRWDGNLNKYTPLPHQALCLSVLATFGVTDWPDWSSEGVLTKLRDDVSCCVTLYLL